MGRNIAGIATTLIVASATWYGAPPLADHLSLAWQLRGMSMEERRATLFAPWYEEARRMEKVLPRDAVVDLVMATPAARDIAVFTGTILQPRVCQYFDGLEAWNRRERATFLRDARAANAAAGTPVHPAGVVLIVDTRANPMIRVAP
jgi:hypothetical protein